MAGSLKEAEVRSAYRLDLMSRASFFMRAAARRLHPDRGGTCKEFQAGSKSVIITIITVAVIKR